MGYSNGKGEEGEAKLVSRMKVRPKKSVGKERTKMINSFRGAARAGARQKVRQPPEKKFESGRGVVE